MPHYVFDPDELQRIVQMHVDAPLEEKFARITDSLADVYGEHVQRGEEWIWSNAGGIMCSMQPLYVRPWEYLLFCGTAVGTEGHSGRHRADLWDVVVHGELRTFAPSAPRATVHLAGGCSYLARGQTNGSALGEECWLLEYARGNVPSMLPFALGDTLFSTVDATDFRKALGVATRLMVTEAKLAMRRRMGLAPRFEPPSPTPTIPAE